MRRRYPCSASRNALQAQDARTLCATLRTRASSIPRARSLEIKSYSNTGIGVFTIVDVQSGQGSDTGWGKLKSGAGWISLDYTKKL